MTYTIMADGRADIDTETPLSEIEPDGDWMNTLSLHDRGIVAVVVAWNWPREHYNPWKSTLL